MTTKETFDKCSGKGQQSILGYYVEHRIVDETTETGKNGVEKGWRVYLVLDPDVQERRTIVAAMNEGQDNEEAF